MKTYDKIHSFNVYTIRSPLPVLVWVLGKTAEQAKNRVLLEYPHCIIVTTTSIFKHVLSTDKHTFNTSVFNIDVSSNIYTPHMFVVANNVREAINICTDRYPAIENINIELLEGLVLSNNIKEGNYSYW